MHFYWVINIYSLVHGKISFLFLCLFLVLNARYEMEKVPAKDCSEVKSSVKPPHHFKVFKIIQAYLLQWSKNLCTKFSLSKRCVHRLLY